MLGKIKKKAAALRNRIKTKNKKVAKNVKKSSAQSSSKAKPQKDSLRKKIARKIKRNSQKKPEKKNNLSVSRFSERKKNILLDSISALVSEEKVAFSQSRYNLGEIRDKENVKIKLPERYFDNKAVLMVRDPWWLCAYWDISSEREKNVKKKIPSSFRSKIRKIIRVYEVRDIKEDICCDIEIENVYFGNWYINVNKPETTFYVEIGYLTPGGNFYVLARSNKVSTPYFGLSAVEDEEWIMPEEDYLKLLGLYNLGKSSMEIAGRIEEIFKRQVSSLPSSSYSLQLSGVGADSFFFELATELIIYGRTEPGALLKLGNRKVSVAKDGTFKLRFLLPEGRFSFPFEASSSSGRHKIKISPQVERSTL